MDALFQSFLALFDPITSSRLLAAVGLVAMVVTVLLLVTKGTEKTADGMDKITKGLMQLCFGLFMLVAALFIAVLAYILSEGTLAHIRH
ncbi:MAG: hypothetical protein H5T64_08740 [Chloroflexi bacterium]|nr:hypothetical protein [Chloroflexota bacterium]